VSQTADGTFQAALAGAVLFNPDHHTGPRQVAAGFVILLLPYSVIGPFAGVLLDRWRRRQVLVYSALLRAGLVVATAGFLAAYGPTGVGFAATALAVIAVNRFYLSATSAALPSVVEDRRLVLANALSPTAGTVMAIAGAGIGLAVRAVAGSGNHGDAVTALVAAAGYACAALVATRLPPNSLGPAYPDTGDLRAHLRGIAGGMVAGARHLLERPRAANALAVVFGQRFLFGLWSMMALLLYRNAFHSEGILRAGLVGAGQAIAAAGVGLVLAAAVTPWITERIGKRRWIVLVTVGVALTTFLLGMPFTMPALIGSAFVLGGALQATKVCVDTIVQEAIEDDFRGRVFALYDTAFNLSFIAASVIGAFVLPADGRSLPALAVIAGGYGVLGVGYALAERGHPPIAPTAQLSVIGRFSRENAR